MRDDIRCIDGTSYKHLPANDDPDFEIAIGRCAECSGKGCRQLFIAEAEAKIGEKIKTKKIKTNNVYPPIPDRRFDWCAVTDNYDGEGSPIGWGRTEEDAIEDLVAEIEDRRAA
jgi:hypothetical protein